MDTRSLNSNDEGIIGIIVLLLVLLVVFVIGYFFFFQFIISLIILFVGFILTIVSAAYAPGRGKMYGVLAGIIIILIGLAYLMFFG